MKYMSCLQSRPSPPLNRRRCSWIQFHDRHVKSVLDILSDYVNVQYVKSVRSTGSTLSLGVIDLKSEKCITNTIDANIFTNSLTGLLISGIVSRYA